MPVVPTRILEFSRDPLFGAVYPDRTDWVPTGTPLEPVGRATAHAGVRRRRILPALVQALGRRYDLIVLPAIRISTPGDRLHRAKRISRRALIAISGSRMVAQLVTLLFGLDSITHVLRDVGDFPEIEEVSTGLFPHAQLYLKREVLESDLGTRASGGPIVSYVPMPFEINGYRLEPAAKTTDVFFAARDRGDYRRQAREALQALAAEGVVVDIPQERLAFEDYLARMSRARLVVSPRGQGEHCYRHYEALLVGAVPVINYPDKPIYYELEDGVTALFYDPNGNGLREVVLGALADPDRLDRIAAAGSQLVETRHSKNVICQQILERLGASAP